MTSVASSANPFQVPRYDFGNIQIPGGGAGQFKPEAPALYSPGSPSPKLPGWGEQWNQFLTGAGKFASGLGTAVAAFKGQPIMAGDQMMAQFGMDSGAGKSPEDNVANLENVLKILQQYGVIGSGGSKLPEIKLDTGSDTRIS